MPAKTTQQLDDLSNPYGYSEMDWAAQLDPAYATARTEVRRLSVGEEGTLSVKVKELVVIGVVALGGVRNAAPRSSPTAVSSSSMTSSPSTQTRPRPTMAKPIRTWLLSVGV